MAAACLNRLGPFAAGGTRCSLRRTLVMNRHEVARGRASPGSDGLWSRHLRSSVPAASILPQGNPSGSAVAGAVGFGRWPCVPAPLSCFCGPGWKMDRTWGRWGGLSGPAALPQAQHLERGWLEGMYSVGSPSPPSGWLKDICTSFPHWRCDKSHTIQEQKANSKGASIFPQCHGVDRRIMLIAVRG